MTIIHVRSVIFGLEEPLFQQSRFVASGKQPFVEQKKFSNYLQQAKYL